MKVTVGFVRLLDFLPWLEFVVAVSPVPAKADVKADGRAVVGRPIN